MVIKWWRDQLVSHGCLWLDDLNVQCVLTDSVCMLSSQFLKMLLTNFVKETTCCRFLHNNLCLVCCLQFYALYRLSAFATVPIRWLQVDNCNNRDWSTIIRMLQRFLYRRRPGVCDWHSTLHVHKVKQVQDYEGEYVDIERNSEARISGSYFALNLHRTARVRRVLLTNVSIP